MRMGSLTGFFHPSPLDRGTTFLERTRHGSATGIFLTRLSDPFDQKKATNKDTDQ